MRLPRRAAGVALAVVLLGAAVVLLARAPVPAVSGPSTAALTGPESVPHTHVMTAASGAQVPARAREAAAPHRGTQGSDRVSARAPGHGARRHVEYPAGAATTRP